MDRIIAAQVYMRICELGSLSAAARALVAAAVVARPSELAAMVAGRDVRRLPPLGAGPSPAPQGALAAAALRPRAAHSTICTPFQKATRPRMAAKASLGSA
mgnify:CR=1 FL=1